MDPDQFSVLVDLLNEIRSAVHSAGLVLCLGLGWILGVLLSRR